MDNYKILYCDISDPKCPTFSQTVKAKSMDHAETLFWESGNPDNWDILDIAKMS